MYRRLFPTYPSLALGVDQAEFCWICMGDWSEHGSSSGGYYKCNKYEAKEGDGDNDVAKAKAELDRYLHYYKR